MRRPILLLAVTVLVLAFAAPRTGATSFKDHRSLGLVDHLDQTGDAGPLDATFGSDGRVITAFGPHGGVANAVAIQADGNIVVCGASGRGHFALARYGTDGTLDPSFGEGGKVAGGHAGAGGCYALAIQTDGKIVAGGRDLSRYNPDGTQDSTFGENGIVDVAVNALAIQRDGRIVTADYVGLARFNTDGTPDTTFGGDGTVAWGPFVCCPVDAGASNIAVHLDLLAAPSEAVSPAEEQGVLQLRLSDSESFRRP